MMNFWLLFFHMLGASVWIGGHIYPVLIIVPNALKQHNAQALLNFEQGFEKLGMSALITQVITGLIMANQLLPNWSQRVNPFFNLGQDITILLTLKFTWLICTILTALSAQLLVIPRLKQALIAENMTVSQKYFKIFVAHISLIMLLGLAFVVTGVLFRTGLGILR